MSDQNLLKKLDAKVNKLRETVLDLNERVQKVGTQLENLNKVVSEMKESLAEVEDEEEEEEEEEEW